MDAVSAFVEAAGARVVGLDSREARAEDAIFRLPLAAEDQISLGKLKVLHLGELKIRSPF